MPATLLPTKTTIPLLRPGLLSRPQLFRVLNDALGRESKLILVTAPAGYGKTTLLVDWLHAPPAGNPVSTWLSLDEGDNNPIQFWVYFFSALARLPGFTGTRAIEAALNDLQSSNPPAIKSLLTELVNAIMSLPGPSILVLDDLHLITRPEIHEDLLFLVENLPLSPNRLQLVIGSRQDPPWPIARLRSRGELLELRVNDLRFNHTETTTYFKQALDFTLSGEQINSLDARLEGWIAGMQMAVLSMQGRDEIIDFIEQFSGRHRYILDYLIEEVLNLQTPEIQEFLLRTSILDRLTESLCEAVCYGESGEAARSSTLPGRCGKFDSWIPNHLQQLENANLFVIPLDDTRQWYRYHHLFADLLSQRLRIEYPGLEKTLHLRASIWYEANQWISDALHHALLSGEVDRAARIAEDNAFTMLDTGRLAALKEWLNQVPASVQLKHPWLGIACAWVMAYAGDPDGAELKLDSVESSYDDLDSGTAGRAAGHVDAIRAYAAWLRGEGAAAVSYARAALVNLPPGDHTVRVLTLVTLGSGLIQQDEILATDKIFQEALQIAEISGNTHVRMLAVSGYGYCLTIQGRLSEAEALCQKAIEAVRGLPGGHSPAVAQVYSILSEIYLERDEIEKALEMAQSGMHIGERWDQADTLTLNCVSLVNALVRAGDLSGAEYAVERARQVGENVSSWFKMIIANQEARIMLARGNLEAAAGWIQTTGLSIEDDLAQPARHIYRTLVKIFLTQGRIEEASFLLDRLIQIAERVGSVRLLVGCLPLKSIVYLRQGRRTEAFAILDWALSLAGPERFRKPFLDAGEEIIPLVIEATVRSSARGFASDLLEHMDIQQPIDWEKQRPPRISPVKSEQRFQELILDPLTEREMEVLGWMDSSLSVPDIAEQMIVAPSTVRTHVRNIYSKLDVHNRFEAVNRAKELNLI